ncbi:TPA: hypothetical protein ACKP39_001169 [Stenotrophomonas maltophilia]
MSTERIAIYLQARPDRSISIAERHLHVMDRMSAIPCPLGFHGLELPPVPDCGEELLASYEIKTGLKGLSVIGTYAFRGPGYEYADVAASDEIILYGFRSSNKAVDYPSVLRNGVASVAEAFGAYRVKVTYGMYSMDYQDGVGREGPTLADLKAAGVKDVDGRKNILTMYPAQFWDARLCSDALGFGPEEVFSRLEGKVDKVELTASGVYILLSDKVDLSYEEYLEFNRHAKALLGLQ